MNFLNLNNASFTMDTLLRIAVYFLQCRLHLIKYVLLGVILTLPLLANAENYSRLFSHDGINPEVLIVTDQNAKLYRIKGPSANIAPMTIMWRLKITDALDSRNPVIERKGKKYYCVGGPNGEEWGYVDSTKVIKWTSNYVLAPFPPKSDCIFRVYSRTYSQNEFERLSDQQIEDVTMAKASAVSSNVPSYAFILDNINSQKRSQQLFKHVLFYNKPGADASSSNDNMSLNNKPLTFNNPNPVDFGLDIVFVIDTTHSMQSMIDQIKHVCKNIAKSVRDANRNRKKVHFGLVEFRDSEVDIFGARMVCDLTEDYDTFLTRLNSLKAEGGGDVANDVLFGLKLAVDNSNWHKYTIKNIILIGKSPNKVTSTTRNITNFNKLYYYANNDLHVAEPSKIYKKIFFNAIVGGRQKSAVQEYFEISDNCGTERGFFGNMASGGVFNEITMILNEAISSITDVNGNNIHNSKTTNLNDHVVLGYACECTNHYRKCASLQVMILRADMEDFVDSLSSAYRRLDKLVGISSGNDKTPFNKFLEEFVGIASNSVIDEDYDMNLETILGLQMPVNTTALKIKIKDVMRMDKAKRADWLMDIKYTRDCAQAILNNNKVWMDTFHDINIPGQKYAFIPVEALP